MHVIMLTEAAVLLTKTGTAYVIIMPTEDKTMPQTMATGDITTEGITTRDAAGSKMGEPMRSEQEVTHAIEQYADMVRRLCMIHLKNYHDTQDIFQTVFLKYVLSSVVFENREHEKAWFARVTINACKDLLKNFFRSHAVPLDELSEQPAALPPDYREVIEAVQSLPPKYKNVVYLHYYEGYTAPEIGKILGKKTNTVYTLLARSKKMLREKLGGDAYE